MNPEIDLNSFRRNKHGGVTRPTNDLVAPPGRIGTRYVLPLVLMLSFAGMFAYATRDALVPVIEVQVVQPVPAANSMASLNSISPSADHSSSEKTPATTTQTTAIAAPNGQPIFQAPGWIEPDPFTTLVSSLIPGTLSEVYVREGDTVAAGAIIAELDATDARIALQKAEANLSVRQAELTAAEQNWAHPIVVNQTLKTAQAEKARLEAEKIKLQRQYEFQTKLASISQELGRAGADSRLTAEKAALEARVAQATVQEIDARLVAQEAMIEGATSNSQLRIEDKSALSLARARLEEAVAALNEAQVSLERCQVVAPTTGTVMRLHKTPGAMVSSDVPEGTQIVSMYNPRALQVRAEVPLAEAGKIEIGLPAEVRVEAMPDRVFTGELTRVVHQADVQRNSLQVKVRILDPEPTLKPEMIARVQFKSKARDSETASFQTTTAAPRLGKKASPQPTSRSQAFLVPESVFPANARGEVEIWLVSSDMRARRKQVIVGQAAENDLIEVSSGLLPSDKIIISNLEKLKDGRRISISPQQAAAAGDTH